MPLVSVVMPTYNAEKTISLAVHSVLNQTFRDLELIIIDDASTDSTEEIIRSIDDSRIKYIKNAQNSGTSYSRNLGVSESVGEWIAFLDSDDFWNKKKLEKQLKLHEENPDAILSYTASAFIDQNGKPYSYIMEATEKTDYNTLLKRNIVSCSSALIKSDIIKKIKMPGDYMSEDYYIWLKVLKNHKFAYGINEPLLTYRLSQNSKSSNRVKAAKMTYHTYRGVGFSPLTSLFLVLRYATYSIKKRYKITKKILSLF